MKTVLVVDDEKNARLLCFETLGEAGYRVLGAANGQEGLEKIKSHQPDLLILDIKMPQKHGLDVLEEMHQAKSDLPIIVCSAYSQHMTDFEVWSSKNVVAYLTKPVDTDQLVAKVKEALGE